MILREVMRLDPARELQKGKRHNQEKSRLDCAAYWSVVKLKRSDERRFESSDDSPPLPIFTCAKIKLNV
jgi:hypothetical protein